MHDHTHSHGHHHHSHGIIKNLWLVFVLNVSFTIIEFIGGNYTNSIAIVSDAFHDLGDSLAILGAIILERVAHKQRNTSYTYGYRRYSILSAIGVSLILIGGSVFVIYEAIPRLSQDVDVNSIGMLWLAVLGVLVNGMAVFSMFKSKDSLNQKAIMLHMLEDTLGWVAVLVGATLIYFTGYSVIDPILSLLIAAFILFNAFKSFKKGLDIMLQKAPKQINNESITAQIEMIDMVNDVHDLHVWTLDGEKNVATLHIRLKENCTLDVQSNLKKQIRDVLGTQGLQHVTIEFDSIDAECAFENC